MVRHGYQTHGFNRLHRREPVRPPYFCWLSLLPFQSPALAPTFKSPIFKHNQKLIANPFLTFFSLKNDFWVLPTNPWNQTPVFQPLKPKKPELFAQRSLVVLTTATKSEKAIHKKKAPRLHSLGAFFIFA